MRIFLSLLINGLVIFACASIFSGIHVAGYWHAVVTALVLGIVNFFIRPILTILTLPITIITLGLFLLIINGAMVLLADALLDNFNVDGLGWAILLSLILSAANYIFAGSEKE